ncbi:MAG: hypothetical protein HONBIEJF_01074 [Fimbriimonadaceae bacterium]|nr:hypothetical protein [Fimbriimonadaceae bacterium]
MAKESLKRLIGSRTRFQRFSDARIFNGWVISLNQKQVRVRFDNHQSFAVGQPFSFHIFGGSSDATFEAVLAEFDDGEVTRNLVFNSVDGKQQVAVAELAATFAIYSSLRFSPGLESRRVAAEDFEVVVIHDESEIEANPKDKSASGLGLLMRRELPLGEKVSVRMRMGTLTLEVEARVRSCRASGVLDQPFRIGLVFVNPDRIFTGRWSSLLEAA